MNRKSLCMSHSLFQIPFFLWPIAAFLLLSLSLHTATRKAAAASSSESTSTDQHALLSFKSALSDPHGALISWRNGSKLDLCSWNGVSCGPNPAKRVTALELDSLELAGPLSPSLSDLTFLRKLHLPYNLFQGSIPQELGNLSKLEYLNLTRNSFGGEIPPTLSGCSNLHEIILGGNSLSGEIPAGFSSLPKLDTLILGNNNLTGFIPPLLGNNSALTYVNLSANHLSGSVPQILVNNSALIFLDLSKNHLTGSIPASVGKISNLLYLDLSSNNLVGSIPPLLGTGMNLVTVDLSSNNLSQNIPPSLGNSSTLYYLSLAKNGLTGKVPPFLQSSKVLSFLDLSENQLSGEVPQSLGNLSSLQYLYLDQNRLQGSIPESLGSIPGLLELYIPMNNLSGNFPSSFYNLSSINYISFGKNGLSGILWPTMGMHLPMLRILDLQENKFQGPVPPSLCNASRLQILDLAGNRFGGMMPSCLGTLKDMIQIDVGWNELQSHDMSFLTSLTNCSHLNTLNLQQNKLQGELPASIGNFSVQLESLWVGFNQISGRIPSEIGHLAGLTVLFMNNNLFSGSIPSTISNLWKLNALYLSGNKLTGLIPFSIGNLTQLNGLYMEENELSGNIPSSLGMKWRYLAELNLSNNAFSGSIPKEVISLSSLTRFLDLSYNSLSGPLPFEVGGSTNLVALNVSNNRLSGEIPSTLGSCIVLQYLKMENNFFQGSIPKAFRYLSAMIELDLSQNNLSGQIPEFFENFSFQYLNLSFNSFEGKVPENGVFSNASAVSLTGNKKLCGGNPILHLQHCSERGKGTNKLKILLPIAIAVVIMLLLSFCIIYYRSSKKNSPAENSTSTPDSSVTYADILSATNGLSNANLIGSGSFGCVYKGKMLIGENTVAVKVLNIYQRGIMTSFINECAVLRSVRHRNLLKILTLCSSLDSKGNEFKALVFPYMPNGSLEIWLHPENVGEYTKPKRLTLHQRLNIAIDVASALDYLHHNCVPPIVHCDIKPSNILLDDNMTAVVGDFGLARFMSSSISAASSTSTSLLNLRGSIGYVAPEYGMGGQISRQGDVYSYGALLLEMLTGRRPTDDAFVDGVNLHKFVEKAFPEMITEILDPLILQEVKGEANVRTFKAHMKECMVSLFQIGLSCSSELPRERMDMDVVIKELISIRDIFQIHHFGQ